jgi:hypothetical protein
MTASFANGALIFRYGPAAGSPSCCNRCGRSRQPGVPSTNGQGHLRQYRQMLRCAAGNHAWNHDRHTTTMSLYAVRLSLPTKQLTLALRGPQPAFRQPVGRSRPFNGRSLLLAEGRPVLLTRPSRQRKQAAIWMVFGRPRFIRPVRPCVEGESSDIDGENGREPALDLLCA